MSEDGDDTVSQRAELSHAGTVLIDGADDGQTVPLGRGIRATKEDDDLWAISSDAHMLDWICPSRFLSAQEILTHCYSLTGGGTLPLDTEDDSGSEPETRKVGYQ